MPRTRTSTDTPAVTKRATSTRTKKAAAPRKRAPRKTEVEETPEVISRTPARKAPTTIATENESRRRSVYVSVFVGCVSLALFITGIMVGMSDDGQIDVVALTEAQNERILRGEVVDERTGLPVTRTIPVQNTDNRPNGGLRPSAQPSTPAATPATTTADVATTTASSTDAEGGTEDDVEVVATSTATTTETDVSEG